ncbi:MAG: 50S ribosomal protein L24e [Candidatus Micrarchaeia archaeon]
MRCSYCMKDIPKGTGFIYVSKNGDMKHYCSRRCYKYDKVMHRKINKKEIEANTSKQL